MKTRLLFGRKAMVTNPPRPTGAHSQVYSCQPAAVWLACVLLLGGLLRAQSPCGPSPGNTGSIGGYAWEFATHPSPGCTYIYLITVDRDYVDNGVYEYSVIRWTNCGQGEMNLVKMYTGNFAASISAWYQQMCGQPLYLPNGPDLPSVQPASPR